MNLLMGILMWTQLSTASDTLRTDGYYITVNEESAKWTIEYYSPQGYFTDSAGQGTPPVLERGMFPGVTNIVYTVRKEKEGFTIRCDQLNLLPYHISGYPLDRKCKIEKGDLVVLAFRNNLEKKWKKVKVRYYFIPF